MSESLKELRMRVKELRTKHTGAVISKATAEQLKMEIEHHMKAVKSVEAQEKRLEALKKAREVKSQVKADSKSEPKPATEVVEKKKSVSLKKKSSSE
jgi:hypothetical protein